MHVLGCSYHKTPVGLRERLAFNVDQARSALTQLRCSYPKTEAVLLSTCNRVELYTATAERDAPGRNELARFIAGFHQIDRSVVDSQLQGWEDTLAVRHLFQVTSSLDSMVVGESQIASQVKAAYQLACQQQAAGPITHAAFQASLRIAHRVANETEIHRNRVSVPSVAVADIARRIFERFDDKDILLIGAGEMAGETMTYLQAEGAVRVTVVNRNMSRAEELAARWNGRVRPWSELLEVIAAADLVVSTTSASGLVVTAEDFRAVEPLRHGRPLLILDLAVPRDFDPDIGRSPSVYLYSVDDLQAACDANRRRRQQDLPRALQIVDREADQFMSVLNQKALGPIVQRLRKNWHQVKDRELQTLARKLPELDQRARNEVACALDRLVNKLLHPPLESLRRESSEGVPDKLLHAVSLLFKLDE
ncbi:MAG: glutamyl-tRNA reductase [Thermoguttaceae bacterium]